MNLPPTSKFLFTACVRGAGDVSDEAQMHSTNRSLNPCKFDSFSELESALRLLLFMISLPSWPRGLPYPLETVETRLGDTANLQLFWVLKRMFF